MKIPVRVMVHSEVTFDVVHHEGCIDNIEAKGTATISVGNRLETLPKDFVKSDCLTQDGEARVTEIINLAIRDALDKAFPDNAPVYSWEKATKE